MILGGSGSRLGLSPAQLAVAYVVLFGSHAFVSHVGELHHGDCVGADAQLHAIMRAVNTQVPIVGHPPAYAGSRAYCAFDRELPVEDFTSRNRRLVDASDALLALPETVESARPRSGTWMTIRYAVTRKHPVLIVYRDGTEERR